MRQLPVAGEFAHVEIHAAVVALVGDALSHEPRDERYHLRDVVGGRGIHLCRLDIQSLEVGEEGVLVGLRICGQLHAGGVRAAYRLVIDVREVHDLADLPAVELDRPAQNILEYVGAEVADVGVVVNGRPARVHADFTAVQRRELLFAPRQRIHHFHAHQAILYHKTSRLARRAEIKPGAQPASWRRRSII